MPGKPDLTGYLGKSVHVEVDRPLGSVHPSHPEIVYTLNYGFVPGTTSGDGMPVDVYLLGPDIPMHQAEGVVIAVVLRDGDIEDKLVVATGEIAPNAYREEEIMRAISFQEQYFESRLVMSNKPGNVKATTINHQL
jgi:inorganic pyrophosphatase